MTNVAVACWSITNLPGNAAATEIDNIPAMSRHISFDTVMAGAVNAMPNHAVKIFIAPEYLFTERDGSPAGNRDMIPASRSQKHSIYGRLRLISSRYPTVYIIAGTIAYEKRALGGVGRKHSYNVCPILYGGEIIKTIYKSEDDAMLQSEGVFGAKGEAEAQSPLFDAGAVSVGVDICADYNGTQTSNDGRLARYITRMSLPQPDIHVQISGTNAALPGKAQAKQDGAYVHCDLGRGSKAFRITGHAGLNTQYAPLTGQSIHQSVGSLHIFDLVV